MVTSTTSPYHSSDTHVFLVTPPPVGVHQRSIVLSTRTPPIALDRDFEVTKEYAMAVKQIGEEQGLGVVDVWTGIWDKAGRDERALSKYLEDGLHLNADGHEAS
jgi:isoamyl acetate esterase